MPSTSATRSAAAAPPAKTPRPSKKGALKLPKSMGACADLLFKTRETRLALQKQVEALAADEATVREHIINTLPKDSTGAAGHLCRVSVVTKQIPQVKSWEDFYAYIKKTSQFDLMQRRISDAAIKERWDNGKTVPGVESFGAVSLSINKL